MRINYPKEVSSHAREQIERLKEWYRHLDYFWGNPAKKDEVFNEFFESFSTCPICNQKNDKALLIDLYLSKDSGKEYIKKNLIRLMKLLTSGIPNVKIGIPCCECFKNLQ